MSLLVIEANAQLGAYMHEVPIGMFTRVSQVLGRVCTERIEPDQGLDSVDRLTANTALPFAHWRAEHGHGPAVQDRINLQHNYTDIAASVTTITSPLAGIRRDQPGRLLGTGHRARGYLLGESTDDPTVVKVPRSSLIHRIDPPQYQVEGRLETLLPGRGIAGYEQVKAINYKLGVVGVSLMPGVAVSRMNSHAASAITDEHLEKACETVEQVSAVGVVFDFVRNNTNHDAPGLGFYDAVALTKDSPRARVANSIGLLTTLLTVGVDLPRRAQTVEQAAARRELANRLVALRPELAEYLPPAKNQAHRRIASRFKIPIRHPF